MKIDRFDGGISRRLLPQYLAPNEAVDLVNVDTDKGALVPTKDRGLPVFDSMVNANYGINAMDRWFWFGQYTPSVEANNRLYYADSEGVLRSFTEDGSGAAAFLSAPSGVPTLASSAKVENVPSIAVAVSGVVQDTTKAPNRPTQYLLVVRKQGNSLIYSTPSVVDVVDASTYFRTNVEFKNLEAEKRSIEEFVGSSRTVTFTIPTVAAGTTVMLGRLVAGKFRLIGSVTSSGQSIADDKPDSALLSGIPNIPSFSGGSTDHAVSWNPTDHRLTVVDGKLRADRFEYYGDDKWINGTGTVSISPSGTFSGTSIAAAYYVSQGGEGAYTFKVQGSGNRLYFTSELVVNGSVWRRINSVVEYSGGAFSLVSSDEPVIGYPAVRVYNGALRFYVAHFQYQQTSPAQPPIVTGWGSGTTSIYVSPSVGVADIMDDWLKPELNGEVSYVQTFYNAGTGEESGPSRPLTITLNYEQAVTVSVQQSTDGYETRLYRSGSGTTAFTLVGSTSNGQVIDTASAAGGTLLDIEAANPPGNISSLTFSGGRMWAASGDRVYFSGIGKPWRWSALGFLAFNKPVQSVQAVANGVLVCLPDTTHLVTGTDESSFASLQISGSQGCVHDKTMAVADGLAIWLSNDGICASSGSDVRLLSRDKLDFLRLSTPGNAVIWNDTYVLLDSTIGGQGLIMMEYGEGLLFKRVSTSYNKFIATYNDKLFIGNGTDVRELFASTAYSQLRYVSPKYAEGSVTTAKVYTEVRVYHKGDIMLEVYINDELVTSKLLTGTDNSLLKNTRAKEAR